MYCGSLMHSSEHEFSKPASPPVPYINDTDNLHISTRFEGTANKIIHITNYNARSSAPPDNFPDESCDSYIDIEEASVSLPGKPSNDGTETYQSFMAALTHDENIQSKKREQFDPYNRINLKSRNTSPHEELNELIRSVEVNKSINHDSNPATPNESVIDNLTLDIPRIEILEEPETTYRARYESEGCKGPIHGASETGFPSIKIVGYVGEVKIYVYVVTCDLEPHLHAATGPGSSKASCQEVKLEDGTPAIEMVLSPVDESDEMIAVFDQLSIRRIRNFEADRELRKRGIEPSTWKTKKKEAKLAFQVKIPQTNLHPTYVLTNYSRTFLCTAPSGNPEIWWMSKNESPPEGGDDMGFIGKKFASGFKVRFFSREDDGNTWEAFADIDKQKSNLNACVIRVPPYKDTALKESVIVHVEIRVGSEKEPRCSEPFNFVYEARSTERCNNCTQIKSFLQKLCNGEVLPTSLPNINLENITIKSEQASPVKKTVPTVFQQPAIVKSVNPISSASFLDTNLRTLLKPQTASTITNLITIPSEGRLKSLTVVPPLSSAATISSIPAAKVLPTNPKTIINTANRVANISILPTVPGSLNGIAQPMPVVPTVTPLQSLLQMPVVSSQPKNVLLSDTSNLCQTSTPVQLQLVNKQFSSAVATNACIVNQNNNFTNQPISTTISPDKIKQEQSPFQNFQPQTIYNNSVVATPILTVATSLASSSPQQIITTQPTIETMLPTPMSLNHSNTNSVPASPAQHSPINLKSSTPISTQTSVPIVVTNGLPINGTNLPNQTNLQTQLVTLNNIMQTLKKQLELAQAANQLQTMMPFQQQQQQQPQQTNDLKNVNPTQITYTPNQIQLTNMQIPPQSAIQNIQAATVVSTIAPQQQQQQQHTFLQNLEQQHQQHQTQQANMIQQQLETASVNLIQQLANQHQEQPKQQQQQQQQIVYQQPQEPTTPQQNKTFQIMQQQNISNDFSKSISDSFNNPVITATSLNNNLTNGVTPMSISLQAYQTNQPVSTTAFNSQQLLSPSFDQLTSSQQRLPSVNFQDTVASLAEQWNPPSINDAIASNKVGFKENPEAVLVTNGINVDHSNSFLNNLQQMNNANTALGLDNSVIFTDANIQQTLPDIQPMETNQQLTNSS